MRKRKKIQSPFSRHKITKEKTMDNTQYLTSHEPGRDGYERLQSETSVDWIISYLTIFTIVDLPRTFFFSPTILKGKCGCILFENSRLVLLFPFGLECLCLTKKERKEYIRHGSSEGLNMIFQENATAFPL